MTTEGLSRRNALAGAATVGIGLPLLAACSGGSDDSANDPSASGGSGATASGDRAGAHRRHPGGRWHGLQRREGRGHPADQGRLQGLHRDLHPPGLPVADVADGTINCTCHGSQFSIEDGSVARAGRRTAPLAAIDLTVKGGKIPCA